MAAGVEGFRPDRMAKARAKAGLSYRALARVLDVSYVILVEYETGVTKPRPPRVVSLANALGCTTIYLAPLPRSPTLIEYRERAGLTRQDIGDQLGMHPGSVARVERGMVWPQDPALAASCYGLGLEEFSRAWRRAATQPHT